MKFDNVMRLLGEFGTYQKRNYVLVCLPVITISIQTMVSVFTLGVPEHRCALPKWDNDTYAVQNNYHRQHINLSVPLVTYPSSDEEKMSKCELFGQYSSDSNTTHNSTTYTYKCQSYVYEKTDFETTFVTEMNLVCQKKTYRTHAMMAFMGGFTFGSLALGIVADGFGRKKGLMLSLVLHIGSCIAVSFANDFLLFVVLRFIAGISVGGILGITFVMGLELVGPSKRMWAGIVIEFFWSFGTLLLALLAFFVRDWHHLQLVLSIPTVLFLSYAWFIPESARWLLTKGRDLEADHILRKAAKVNKVELPEKLFDEETFESEKCVPVWKIFISFRLMMRTLIIFLNWMVTSMVFYGLGLNVGNLGGNIYINYFLSSVAETIGFASCLLFLNRWGRKPMHVGSMFLGGLACLGTIFPVIYGTADQQWITVTLAMIGKLGASAAFATIWVFSAELYPTIVRNSAMGASSFCARVGGMISPYIADIGISVEGDMAKAMPLIIFGLATIGAGLLALLLPETLNKELPETVEDAVRYGRKPKLHMYSEKKGSENGKPLVQKEHI